MIYRSKAPLRIGFAGGGTDVSPYSNTYGGAILNATISLYAHASILPNTNNKISLIAADRNEKEIYEVKNKLPITGTLDLAKGVYNNLQKNYPFTTQGFTLTTSVDAPAGSGLGTSSTLVVAILGAFVEMLQLPLTQYDIAQLAYTIERDDLQLAGGKQDQYAATFGGFNFMEFHTNNTVIVNPLRVHSTYLHELQQNLVLFFTATNRESATIIKEQQQNVLANNSTSIDAMHLLKAQAYDMKNALLKGELHNIGMLLNQGFVQKKQMAKNISNTLLDTIYDTVLQQGATGGKISGAGGGGFMVFYCPGTTRYAVITALQNFAGKVENFTFTKQGLTTWRGEE